MNGFFYYRTVFSPCGNYSDQTASFPTLKELGLDGLYIQADASKYDQCQRVVNVSVENFGNKIDALINNADVPNNPPFYTQHPNNY